MLTKLTEGLGSKLADQWVATLLTPSFVFWALGLIAWVWRFGWTPLEKWFTAQTSGEQLILLIGALLAVTASAIIVQRFDLITLRFLEGYWPGWLQYPRNLLVHRVVSQVRDLDQNLQTLAAKGLRNLSPQELNEYTRLDWRRMHMPASLDRLMPTTLGNILRAAELRSKDKYGLDAVVCWPRLWMLLPGDVRQELTNARTALNTAARLCSWSILFLIWIIWAWWVIPIAIFTVLFAYRWMLNLAEIYGDLLDSTFDLYRMELYKSLRWPIPENPCVEHEAGAQITGYLWRGSDSSSPNFNPLEK